MKLSEIHDLEIGSLLVRWYRTDLRHLGFLFSWRIVSINCMRTRIECYWRIKPPFDDTKLW